MKRYGLLCFVLLLTVVLFGACQSGETNETTETTNAPTGAVTSDEIVSGAATTDAATTVAETTVPETEAPKDPPDLSDTVTGRDYVSVGSLSGEYVNVVDNTVFIDAQDPILSLSGITAPKDNNGEYYRLDAFNKNAYPSDIRLLAEETSGVTIRFCTNASSFILKASMRNTDTLEQNPGFWASGAIGFDVYVGRGEHSQLVKTVYNQNGFSEEIALPDGYQDVTVVFPVYAGVTEVLVGLPSDAEIAKSTDRSYGTVVFYGSSITQGACVQKTSGNYVNTVARDLDCDYRNLGFSGSARGEQVMYEYIAAIEDMAAFVLDYDWNADTPAHLRNTHYNFYKAIRTAHPNIPIVMMTRPVFSTQSSAEEIARQRIVKDTYDRAIEEGDTNVYFINGAEMLQDALFYHDGPLCMTDRVHPNDAGHYYMAEAVYNVLKPILKYK